MGDFGATFFDMDGVTVRTASSWRRIEREEILPDATRGEPPSGDVIRALSVDDAYDRLAGTPGVELAVDRAGYRSLYAEYTPRVYREEATLLPGYDAMLNRLRAAEHAVGLVSASPRDWIDIVLDRFDLHDAYDVVVGSDDVDGPTKPAPDAYRQAASAVGVDPARSIAVEDSPHGIEAAVAAGMYCLALRGEGNRDMDLSAADEIVGDADELADRLAALA